MNRTLAVAAREISERRGIFGAAASFALLSFVMAIVPAMGFTGGELVGTTSAVLAEVICWFLAALLGATLIGREVSENRLPFYFSRPLSAGAIWFGKMAAAAVLLVGAFAIMLTPLLAVELATPTHWRMDTVVSYLGYAGLVAAGLFFACHLLGTMARSRSPWIALDLACAVLTVAAFRAILEFPDSLLAPEVERTARLIMLSGLPIVIVLSGLWQLRGGRADRLQQHLALSRFLWGGAAVFLIAGASYTTWAMFVPPGDLLAPHGLRAGGDWSLVAGKVLGRGSYEATLLLNADGRSVRLFIPPELLPDFRFSADGRAAAWLRASPSGHELVHCRLDVRQPHPEGTRIFADHLIALSSDGSLAVTQHGPFAIYDLVTRRLRGVFRLTHRTGSPVIEFAGHDLVRAYVSPYDAGFDIWEFDLRSGQLRDTGKHFWASSDRLDGRSRILTGWEGSAFAQLLNRDTGRRLAAIPNDAWPQGPSALEAAPVFLSDGSVAAPVYTVQLDPLYRTPLRPSESRREVANFSGDDGHRLAGVALGPWEVQRIEGGDRHRVLVTARSTTASNTTLAWVDFDRGVFQPIGVDVQRPIVDPERPLPKEILCETGTSVVAWNPSSGALRVVAGN